LLPDLLIPYAVIRSDSVLKALKEDSKQHSLETTSRILGCLDLRTARKYLNSGIQAVNKASLALSERLISFAGQYSHLKTLPNTPTLINFDTLVTEFNNLQIFIHGGLAYEIQIPAESFIGSNWPKTGDQKPTTFVSAPEDSPDKT